MRYDGSWFFVQLSFTRGDTSARSKLLLLDVIFHYSLLKQYMLKLGRRVPHLAVLPSKRLGGFTPLRG